MDVFKTKGPFLQIKLKEFPVDPVLWMFSSPEEICKNSINFVKESERKFVHPHGVNKGRLENRFDQVIGKAKFFKDLNNKVPSNAIEGFTHINFNSHNPILFIFGSPNMVSGFLSQDDTIMNEPPINETILERRKKTIKVRFEPIKESFSTDLIYSIA
ncbi:hypothetical protein LIER_23298 [Lithospermum erythrorhizon]|uniref:Uncharacterized protein n=1 Tax=Lithospermum erythrorhizon TaxID=34254 RepID=A0AAV3QYA0_LITER